MELEEYNRVINELRYLRDKLTQANNRADNIEGDILEIQQVSFALTKIIRNYDKNKRR